MPFPLKLQTILLTNTKVDLYVPEERVLKEAYETGVIPFPYWGKVWPSAKALAEFLSQHPAYIKDKKVLELGAGLGLPSLIAASYASCVICSDYSEDAVVIAKQSAEHGHLKNFEARVLDWNHLPHELHADVLLLSDINYQPGAFRALTNVTRSFLQKGATIILSTPQRLMAKDFISSLLIFCVVQEEIKVEDEKKETNISILVLTNTTTVS